MHFVSHEHLADTTAPTSDTVRTHLVFSASASQETNLTKDELRARLFRMILQNERARKQEAFDSR
jgi:hypothetical protein